MNSVLSWIFALFFGAAIGVIFQTKLLEKRLKERLKPTLELAYALAQGDAIKGDIRIHIINGSLVVWTKSPWNDEPKACVGDTINIARYK